MNTRSFPCDFWCAASFLLLLMALGYIRKLKLNKWTSRWNCSSENNIFWLNNNNMLSFSLFPNVSLTQQDTQKHRASVMHYKDAYRTHTHTYTNTQTHARTHMDPLPSGGPVNGGTGPPETWFPFPCPLNQIRRPNHIFFVSLDKESILFEVIILHLLRLLYFPVAIVGNLAIY